MPARSHLPEPVRRVLRRVRSRLASPPPPPPARWDPRTRRVRPELLSRTPTTDVLAARLDGADMSAIEAALDAEQRALLDSARPVDRTGLMLALGVHHGVPGVLAKTGLRRDEPPADVHSMSRGPIAGGGSFYYADLVVDALAAGGLRPEAGLRALDFGCSSGRVVRVLAAAHPDAGWSGCDPNRGAIEWAREHLPGIEFEISPQGPPLPWPDGHFRAIFAVSIWSHFGPRAAMAWLAEMRRLLEPGGLLVLTTHGLTSIHHAATHGIRSDAQLEEIASTLYAEGHWYAAEFGERGDHGVVDPDWGTAFLTSEWLLDRACPEWAVREFRPGTVEGNQDLYVLQRPA